MFVKYNYINCWIRCQYFLASFRIYNYIVHLIRSPLNIINKGKFENVIKFDIQIKLGVYLVYFMFTATKTHVSNLYRISVLIVVIRMCRYTIRNYVTFLDYIFYLKRIQI